jgi:5-methylcytosine-specific restriction endonuclease McrA
MSRKRYGGNLEQVIERDKGCVICGAPWRNDVTQIVCHHIDEDTSNNDPSNLVMLCRKCHGFVTFFMQCSDRQAALAFLHKHYL